MGGGGGGLLERLWDGKDLSCVHHVLIAMVALTTVIRPYYA